ncbi:hypothetical protein QJS10_CPB17g00506 [Acorus calamus]|uniref:Uncharacterized protein n=1 Tax=Acorus calamus TaxID=4465 RepID=A0AAV9CQQ2_ACOCL|nr:hypothetical protein QJS10_CPB17g00506 [Acorus calamus]
MFREKCLFRSFDHQTCPVFWPPTFLLDFFLRLSTEANTTTQKMAARGGGGGRPDGLRYAFDHVFTGGEPPPDSPEPPVNDALSSASLEGSPSRAIEAAAAATAVRAVADAMVRMEVMEMEMVKAREAREAERERRRAESEVRSLELMMETQIQIAKSLLLKKSRKRKPSA